MESLLRKAEIATILGTLQSSLTDFRYVRNIWTKNTQEECLLGVSMTGIMDHAVLSGKQKTGAWFEEAGHDALPQILEALKAKTVEVNKEWSTRLGINQSTAITAVKPSGTVSQLVDSASGIHARFSAQYIRTVRSDGKDPISEFLKDAGVPWEKDVMNDDNYVFSFPIKAPTGSTSVDDLNVQQQLDLWEIYQNHYCEHKPSVTIYYSDEEFLAAGQWLWDRLDSCSGISFLPRTDHVYQQAPYTAITPEAYKEALALMPKTINWDDLGKFETEDTTTGTQELACVAGQCEI